MPKPAPDPAHTTHRLMEADARDLSALPDESVDLVVTSPPYPMIAMWDEVFSELSPAVSAALSEERAPDAFEAMHRVLDGAWAECWRLLRVGGFACINIGDATRSMKRQFALWPNHARILQAALELGFTPLPDIHWRKPTNAPNKFMGSGMLPAGAYVTYEHEYLLILRKGVRRSFNDEDRARRARSAYFWEERNLWFSDLWEGLTGVGQRASSPRTRGRTAAYPLELPLRLIRMYSIEGDRVLDPFAGTGTTGLAAAMTGRSSVCVDRDPELIRQAKEGLSQAVELGLVEVDQRLEAHRRFVRERLAAGRSLKHRNERYGFPVITRQEAELAVPCPAEASLGEDGAWTVSYTYDPPPPSRRQLSITDALGR